MKGKYPQKYSKHKKQKKLNCTGLCDLNLIAFEEMSSLTILMWPKDENAYFKQNISKANIFGF